MKNLLKKYNLSLILLHGSQVTGKTHSKSDFDFAVLQKNRNEKLDLFGLYVDIAMELNINNADITNLTFANPLLAQNVALKSKLLAGKKEDYDEFQRQSFFKYNDYIPYLKMEEEFVKERLNTYVTN